jgi:hypothetical protein
MNLGHFTLSPSVNRLCIQKTSKRWLVILNHYLHRSIFFFAKINDDLILKCSFFWFFNISFFATSFLNERKAYEITFLFVCLSTPINFWNNVQILQNSTVRLGNWWWPRRHNFNPIASTAPKWWTFWGALRVFTTKLGPLNFVFW